NLLHELLALELAYRYREGETPTLDEYARRFPDDGSILRAVFAEVVLSAASAVHTATASSASPAGSGLAPPGYEILGELGRGGMGDVYKARQVNADRVVALKMILAGLHASPEARRRFYSEARLIARLQH